MLCNLVSLKFPTATMLLTASSLGFKKVLIFFAVIFLGSKLLIVV